jgi:hypothetical protein
MKKNLNRKSFLLLSLACLSLLLPASGCAVMRYHGPEGESFSRVALGTRTGLSSLLVQTGTNGIRTVELRGYNTDSLSALGAVTEAAVRAAVTGAK